MIPFLRPDLAMNPRLVLNSLRSLGWSWILSTALFKTTGWLGNCSCCQPWAEKSCAQTGRLREELRGHVWLFSILSLNIKHPPPRDPRGWKWVCTKELEPQSSLQVRNCIQSSNLLASSCQSKNTICQLFFVSWGLGTVFLMFKNLFYFFNSCVYVCVCMSYGDPLELKVQALVSCPTWVLRLNSGSQEEHWVLLTPDTPF